MSDDNGLTAPVAEGETLEAEQTTDPLVEPVNPESGEGNTSEADKAAEAERIRQERLQQRFGKLTFEKNEAKREAEALRRQLAEQQGVKPDDPQQLTQAQIRAEAEKLVQAQRFNDTCNSVYESGKDAFADFDRVLSNFGTVGGLSQDFLETAMELPDPHKALYELGKIAATDPDEAERIMHLSPAKMALKLTHLVDKSVPKADKGVSRAPSPIKPIAGGSGGGNPRLDDEKLSMEEWATLRKASRKN